MPRLVLFLILLATATNAVAREFTAHLSWTPVNQLTDGTTVPDASITYQVEKMAGPAQWAPLDCSGFVPNYCEDSGDLPGGTIVTYRLAAIYEGIYSEWSEGSFTVPKVSPVKSSFSNVTFTFISRPR